MDKAERIQKAVELKHSAHNCDQAVVCAYADEIKEKYGIEYDALKAMGSAFGSGMGAMKGTCGALCGAEKVLGLLKFEGKPMHKNAAALFDSFVEKSGSSVCRELKGIDTGVVLCPCDNCVMNAVEALEEALK